MLKYIVFLLNKMIFFVLKKKQKKQK